MTEKHRGREQHPRPLPHRKPAFPLLAIVSCKHSLATAKIRWLSRGILVFQALRSRFPRAALSQCARCLPCAP